jgi:hypothetical protein
MREAIPSGAVRRTSMANSCLHMGFSVFVTPCRKGALGNLDEERMGVYEDRSFARCEVLPSASSPGGIVKQGRRRCKEKRAGQR